MRPFKNWKTTIAGLANIVIGVVSAVQNKTFGETEAGLIIGGVIGILAKDDQSNKAE